MPPIEPPDPLHIAALLAALSRMQVRWENNHIIALGRGGHPFALSIEDSAWTLKAGGSYLIDEESFTTLIGAHDAGAAGVYKATSGARYALHAVSHEGVLWAKAVRVASAA